MPPYRLTSAQKAELRRKYLANIEAINELLPANKQIVPDLKGLNKRLNDPAEQRFYLKSKKISEDVKKKVNIAEQIGEELKDKKLKGHKYAMNRGLWTKMLPSDDPQAKKYNEYIIKQYYQNPEQWTKQRYQTLMNFDAGDLQKFADSKDLKNFLLDFYEQNEEVIDDAFQMLGTLNNYDDNELTPEMRENLQSLKDNYELLGPAMNAARMVKDDGYFTLPPIDADILDAIENANLERTNRELHQSINNKYTSDNNYNIGSKQFKSTMKAFKDFNIDISGPGGLNKWGGTMLNGSNKVVSVSPALYYSGAIEGTEFKLKMFDDNTINGAKKVFKDDFAPDFDFKLKLPPNALDINQRADNFRRDFIYDYALRNNLEIGKLENVKLGTIAENIKGNLKEQIFGTTSRQYKEFTEAMRKFDNPNSRGYKDYRSINLTAQNYLLHKGVFTYEDAAKLPPPGDKRAILCMQAIDAASKYEVDSKLYISDVKKQFIFDPKEVEENPLANHIIKDAPAVNGPKTKITKAEAVDFVEEDQEELDDILKDL